MIQLAGNKNNVADPGETFYLNFKVMNQGSSSIAGQFYVSSNTPELTILEPNVKSGDLKFGETTDIPVKVKLSESASSGSFFSVSSMLDCTSLCAKQRFFIQGWQDQGEL